MHEPPPLRPIRTNGKKFFDLAMLHIPFGWKLKYRYPKGDDLTTGGLCDPNTMTLEVPVPDTRDGLFTFLHECGHASFHGRYNGTQNKPVFLKEYEADMFAMTIMRNAGIPIPRDRLKKAKWKLLKKAA